MKYLETSCRSFSEMIHLYRNHFTECLSKRMIGFESNKKTRADI